MDILRFFTNGPPIRPDLVKKEIEGLFPVLGSSCEVQSIADSPAVFKVITSDGKQFKLRRCENEATADIVVKDIQRFQSVLPQFIGRNRNYILFKWIIGTELHNANLADAAKLGRIIAEVNAIPGERSHEKVISEFNKWKQVVREVVKSPQGIELNGLTLTIIDAFEERFESLRKKIGAVDIVRDYFDAQAKNFSIEFETDDIYCIDELSFVDHIRGMSFPVIYAQIFKHDPALKQAFADAYKARSTELSQGKHIDSIFDQDYHDLTNMMLTVFRIIKGLRKKRIEKKLVDFYVSLALKR